MASRARGGGVGVVRVKGGSLALVRVREDIFAKAGTRSGQLRLAMCGRDTNLTDIGSKMVERISLWQRRGIDIYMRYSLLTQDRPTSSVFIVHVPPDDHANAVSQITMLMAKVDGQLRIASCGVEL